MTRICKKLRLKVTISMLLCVVSVFAHAQEISDSLTIDYGRLENDKEEKSYVVSKKYKNYYLDYFDISDRLAIKNSLYQAVKDVKQDKKDTLICDLGLVNYFFDHLQENGFEVSKRQIKLYLGTLRAINAIDDIFYKLLADLVELQFGLNKAISENTYPINRDLKASHKIFEKNDISYIYQEFKQWPNEENTCALGAWVRLKNKINPVKKKLSDKDIRRLNAKAYKTDLISLESYRRLEFLRESNILKRKIFAAGYLNKVLLAKDTMEPKSKRQYEIPVENEERFAAKKKNIFRKTTMREELYNKYNDEQIVMLAGILKKASMRMGVDPDVQASVPVITQQFTYQNDRGEYVTETEKYTLENASDQYDYARRRMRMDMLKTNSFKTFSHVTITFEDVVMAALETGYISHEEVELALTYDDLWNKEDSKLMQALKVVFKIGGTAVFYLPPPYNIIGGITVALINAKIIYKKDGADYENPAALFN